MPRSTRSSHDGTEIEDSCIEHKEDGFADPPSTAKRSSRPSISSEYDGLNGNGTSGTGVMKGADNGVASIDKVSDQKSECRASAGDVDASTATNFSSEGVLSAPSDELRTPVGSSPLGSPLRKRRISTFDVRHHITYYAPACIGIACYAWVGPFQFQLIYFYAHG